MLALAVGWESLGKEFQGGPRTDRLGLMRQPTKVFFLSEIITMIIIHTLRRDITRYDMLDDGIEESIAEAGWKLVHDDMFRPPFNNRLLAVFSSSRQSTC